jgi:hypothetical protein
MLFRTFALAGLCLLFLYPLAAQAQLSGHNTRSSICPWRASPDCTGLRMFVIFGRQGQEPRWGARPFC